MLCAASCAEIEPGLVWPQDHDATQRLAGAPLSTLCYLNAAACSSSCTWSMADLQSSLRAPPWVSMVDALVQFATPPASLTPEYSQLVKSMELSVRDPVGCIDFILRLCTSVVVLTGQDTSRLFAGRLESAEAGAGAGAGATLGARPCWALLPEAKASRSKRDSIPAAFSAVGCGWIARFAVLRFVWRPSRL